MSPFDPAVLRELRIKQGLSIAKLAVKMSVSPAQIHRLENGTRRLTIDTLLRYCDAIDTDINALFVKQVTVPIIGVINTDTEVLPLTPNTPYATLAPHLTPNPERLAAVRWEASRYAHMDGWLMFFDANVGGIPEDAWSQRCIIRRGNGTQRIGWPIQADQQAHIDDELGQAEFNVDIVWASPILAVLSPLLLSRNN